MEDLTLILCQATADAAPSAKAGKIHPLQANLSQVSATDLNARLLDTPTEMLALISTPPRHWPEELQQSAELLQSDPALKGILLFPAVFADSVSVWQNVPARLAALMENVAERIWAAVFRVSALRELEFVEDSNPLWDVVIRASATPNSLAALQLADDFWMEGNAPAPELPGLVPDPPGRSRTWLKSHLEAVSIKELVPQVVSKPDAIALKAGLFQIHDDLNASHELSQSIEGQGRNAAGDYWHAIMHRREPDYSNAKYWFRHVGNHPIFEPLRNAVETFLAKSNYPAHQHARQKLLSKGQWDPMAFVDLCQECAKGKDPELTRIAEQIQWREMCLLLEQTYCDATA